MAKTLSAKGFAKYWGVSDALIFKWIKMGHFEDSAVKDGRCWTIDVEKAKEALTRNTNSRRWRVKRSGTQEREAAKALGILMEDEMQHRKNNTKKKKKSLKTVVKTKDKGMQKMLAEVVSQEGLTFTEARTMNERLKALLRKLEYEKEVGRLVEKKRVGKDAFELYRRTRDAFLAIPSRTRSLLAAEEDPGKIEKMLTGEIRVVLEELANGTKKYTEEAVEL